MGLILSLLVSGLAGLLPIADGSEDWESVWAQAQTSYSSKSAAHELAALIASRAPGLEHQVASFLASSLEGGAPDYVSCDDLPTLSAVEHVGDTTRHRAITPPMQLLSSLSVLGCGGVQTKIIEHPVSETRWTEILQCGAKLSVSEVPRLPKSSPQFSARTSSLLILSRRASDRTVNGTGLNQTES